MRGRSSCDPGCASASGHDPTSVVIHLDAIPCPCTLFLESRIEGEVAECPNGYLVRHPMTHCYVLRRVLVRCSTIRACDMPLFTDVERAAGVCRTCASGWTHPESYPLAPIFDAAEHARFSLRHWQQMQSLAITAEDRRRAAVGVAVWSTRVADLARIAVPTMPELANREAGSSRAANHP